MTLYQAYKVSTSNKTKSFSITGIHYLPLSSKQDLQIILELRFFFK